MTREDRYTDRWAAGRALAGELEEYSGGDDLLVLGLPRGGVPVAFEVARALAAPLDLFLVRRLALPGDDDIAMGAIASGGVRRAQDPERLVLAVPVGPADTVESLRDLADRVVCPLVPERFESIGEWYHEYGTVSDDRVREIMDRAASTLA